MDGYAATRQIRSLKGAVRRIAVVALTANAAPTEREKCLAAGTDAFLAKLLSRRELAAALTRWLVRRFPEEWRAAKTLRCE